MNLHARLIRAWHDGAKRHRLPQDTRYKIQEALFYVGYIITDNISNYSYFPTKHIIKLIINKCKTGCKKKYILVKTLTKGFLQAERSVMINKHIIYISEELSQYFKNLYTSML